MPASSLAISENASGLMANRLVASTQSDRMNNTAPANIQRKDFVFTWPKRQTENIPIIVITLVYASTGMIRPSGIPGLM